MNRAEEVTLREVLAEVKRTNALLERIAAALERAQPDTAEKRSNVVRFKLSPAEHRSPA